MRPSVPHHPPRLAPTAQWDPTPSIVTQGFTVAGNPSTGYTFLSFFENTGGICLAFCSIVVFKFVHDFCLMSTKFCKVRVEESTASEPSSVADAIEDFLRKVLSSCRMMFVSSINGRC